ncbi:hypothetical protein M427DRAFT_144479 [Gonapodya prolifera JEL478]|uniref:Bulb-type lectin domain-containing protein n=1 Tax=Gonapodya prolifera (strain JEL478) TaxID=1344416 RepID=A0A139AKG2_GONPJ|nr:hypothetical protein M427DRAFT_144479 [Gonapodya prolifera JEL478]|eukprot:KXS17259.1 hypothetical protein M427DRAFT_144479 [Gonapodya prolifera JEL478]
MRVLDTSAGRGNEELLMCAAQSGGDVELVLRARTGKALSVCAGNGGPELSQTEACVLWSSAKGCQVGRWSMESPAVLKCGEELRSPDGHYYLTPQMDGNVVFYDDTTWNKNPSEATRWFKWATRTDKKGTGAKLELRADGELIATNDRNEALWKASGYTPMAGYKYELVVGDGKTLILYRLARGGGAKEEVWRAKPMIIL